MQVANKYLNVPERVEVVEWNKKMVPSLPLLSCESSVSVKENSDRKKNRQRFYIYKRTILSINTNLLHFNHRTTTNRNNM